MKTFHLFESPREFLVFFTLVGEFGAPATLTGTSLVFRPPRGAHFIHCYVDFYAAVVIPSILNLTSSHTRDEVIAKTARHVHCALIG